MRAFIQSIRMALKNLSQNATRTFITLIGIVLSIAAIIMVMSAGESVKQFILGQLGVFGTDLIQVEPRVPSGTTSQDRSSTSIVNALTRITTLNLEDGEAIQKLDNIETFSGGSFGQGQIRYSRERSSSMIFGTSPDMIIVDENIVISEGRFYSEEEDRSLGQVAVLGSGLKEKLFGNRNAVGEKIEINGKGYRVIGVLKERGGAGFLSFDDMLYMPIQTLQKKILGVDYVSSLTVKVKDNSIVKKTAEDVRALLRKRHNIYDAKNDDFEAVSITEGQELVEEVFGAISILLLALASISLIVGGVGIMNVMFVAMEERISEIGLRKAVGARSGDILWQFLVEAVVIALFGACIGLALGVGLVWVIIGVLGYFDIDVAFGVTMNSIFVSISFSVFAGILFGLYPAWRASQIPPTEAMRG
ncbi:MAG: ABC transporter permease [Candidatus Moraniibacteriota bacterium]|nr:MAG: ABC transporter permease [Candidatus Moranbacteria bacterium]